MNRRSADPARVHDAARLLPLLGAVLLMPPVITLFVADVSIVGVPLIVVYLFCTWLALIVCAAWLSRALAAPPSNGDQDPGPPRG
jgi:hypothetical protein